MADPLGYDFSDGRPSPASIVNSGREFVIRYLYDGPKGITKPELDSYLKVGLSVLLNYEGSGKDATSFANGANDARYANGKAASLGYPNAVIYFSIDEEQPPNAPDYARGVESVIGHDRAGFYAGLDTLDTLHMLGLGRWYWLTYAWLHGRSVPSWTHLFQYDNGQVLDGAPVDFDKALQPYYGQINVPSPAGTKGSGMATAFTDTDRQHINAIYSALFGVRNLTGTDDVIRWLNWGGSAESVKYGMLAILVENQLRFTRALFEKGDPKVPMLPILSAQIQANTAQIAAVSDKLDQIIAALQKA